MKKICNYVACSCFYFSTIPYKKFDSVNLSLWQNVRSVEDAKKLLDSGVGEIRLVGYFFEPMNFCITESTDTLTYTIPSNEKFYSKKIISIDIQNGYCDAVEESEYNSDFINCYRVLQILQPTYV